MSLLALAILKKLKTFSLQSELVFTSEQGNVLVLFGPSGSGKSITLKCIAGITDPDRGFISIAGKPVFDSNTGLNTSLQKRNVGYVPQNYALFPHLTVVQNIAFGLFAWKKPQARQRVAELIKLIQLEGLEQRYPRELSGGQQQRVALARALAPKPDILLLDEPLSALDAVIRVELRQSLALFSRTLGIPVVFVTHDLEEAYIMADRIAVYDQGQVLQYGSREDIFYSPSSARVARLISLRNLYPGRILDLKPEQNLVLVRCGLFDIWVVAPLSGAVLQLGQMVTICLRPERVSVSESVDPIAPTPTESAEEESLEVLNQYAAKLVNVLARGSLYTLFVRLGPTVEAQNQAVDMEIEVTIPQYARLRGASDLQLGIAPAAAHLMLGSVKLTQFAAGSLDSTT